MRVSIDINTATLEQKENCKEKTWSEIRIYLASYCWQRKGVGWVWAGHPFLPGAVWRRAEKSSPFALNKSSISPSHLPPNLPTNQPTNQPFWFTYCRGGTSSNTDYVLVQQYRPTSGCVAIAGLNNNGNFHARGTLWLFVCYCFCVFSFFFFQILGWWRNENGSMQGAWKRHNTQ